MTFAIATTDKQCICGSINTPHVETGLVHQGSSMPIQICILCVTRLVTLYGWVPAQELEKRKAELNTRARELNDVTAERDQARAQVAEAEETAKAATTQLERLTLDHQTLMGQAREHRDELQRAMKGPTHQAALDAIADAVDEQNRARKRDRVPAA